MVNDAKAHESEDKAKREKVDTINAADSLVYQTEKQLKELGDKLDADTKARVQAAVDRLKDAIKHENIDEIKSATDALNTIWHEAAAKIYHTQGAGSQNGQASDNGGNGSGSQSSESKTDSRKDDAVDADYQVVKD